jgi:hypothetical protein
MRLCFHLISIIDALDVLLLILFKMFKPEENLYFINEAQDLTKQVNNIVSIMFHACFRYILKVYVKTIVFILHLAFYL